MGRALSEAELARSMLLLQDRGCSNINLVSPTHFAPKIIHSINLAREQGLDLPIVLNSSGYESIESLKEWEGYADLFLMDLKYGDNETGKGLSRVPDYWDRAREAIAYLWEKAGSLRVDDNGKGLSGLIVRHLVLPGMRSNPFAVLEFLAGLSLDIPVSIMSQYNPCFYSGTIPEMGRTISPEEYEVVLEKALYLRFVTIYAQEMDSTANYTPDFSADTPFGDCLKIL